MTTAEQNPLQDAIRRRVNTHADPVAGPNGVLPQKGGSWTTDASGNWSQVDTSRDAIGSMSRELGAAQPASTAAAPAAPSTPQEAAAASPDPFAAIGGGVQVNGGWVPKNHPLAQQANATPATPAAPAQPAAPGQPAAPAAQEPPKTISESFQQALVNKLNNTGPLDASNPAIAGSIAANKLAEQRGAERQRNILAERAAKSGTDASGGFDTDLLGIEQDRAAREGQFAGNAVRDLADRQERGLLAALGIAGQSVGQDKALAQQKILADLDAAIRREGIASQGAIAGRDQDIRSRQGDASINNQLLGILLGHDEFGQQLNQQGAQFAAGLDNNTLLSLIGGL